MTAVAMYRAEAPIEKALWEQVVWGSEFPANSVLWERPDVHNSQNGKERPKPYITLEITSIQPRRARHREIDEAGIITYSEEHEMVLRIKIISLSAGYLGILSRVRSAFRSEMALSRFSPLKMAFRRAGNILNTELRFSTQFVNCGVLDATFSYIQEWQENVGLIERVKVEGEYLHETGVTEVELTIPPEEEE